jgi:hypothetical protein
MAKKIPSTPSFGEEETPAVPCRRFAACKRSLNVTWKSVFKQNSRLLFLPHLSSTSRCLDLLRRVGRGDIWRRQWELLENRVYNKPNGCNATGTLTPGPGHQQQQQQRKQQKVLVLLASLTIKDFDFLKHSSQNLVKEILFLPSGTK